MFKMNIISLLKVLGISLIGCFLSLVFFVMFASILAYNLQIVSWDTAALIVKIATPLIVIGLGAIYVRSQTRLQKPASINNVIKKLTRNVIITLLSGLIITFLFSPLYDLTLGGNTLGVAMLEAGQISGLGFIIQSILTVLIQGPFAFYFTVSFVVVFLFDILRTRESNHPISPRLNAPPIVR